MDYDIIRELNEEYKKIKAIITLYYPQEKHRNNILRIACQVDEVYVCDNSPKSNEHIYKNINKVTYIYWGENRGISYAFNSVLYNKCYKWSESDYILFFDQDTIIPENHVYKLIQEYNRLKMLGVRVGCLGPVYYNTSNRTLEFPRRYKRISKNSIEVQSIITTSMLCRYGDIKEIGFWNEEIFLDMADWDLCWRLLEKGYQCCMTTVSKIHHSVGEGEKKVGLMSLRVGKPIREYYQLRDCRYLLKKKYTPSKYKLRFILMITLRSFLHLLLFDNRKERLMYMNYARYDFLHGIKGVIKIE